ncbi:isopentenyl-diphosphate delta-isomerase type 1 [Geothermobacter ehrlichii]|uniref:Isopentenyl-diphosphate delta-isomerase type 1 n=1 Tax=Geothermobacter ehrlichii TaxID=213224 RepID=A0A5D3WMG5_9BACT|nr:NUDIX domain-containing protein [Geothermobacter ehrlichii]TYO99689.1 isopentenyl-diphosphate delta-isomerase type 1 [Geothermobacter ehrlichii]
MGELFDIVDEHDRVIGQAPRSRCHGDPSLIHRVAHVLVFNSEGRLLLQKRSAGKDIQPGKWDTSVGGHLEPGEDYLTAARREMREELGISGVPLTFLYRSKIRNAIESENVATFMARYDGPIDFAPEEISEVRFWSGEEIDRHLGSGMFTPNFEEEWAMFRSWCRKYPAGPNSGPAFCAGDSFPDIVQTEDLLTKNEAD